ncbi:MAG: transposase, partial [Candidatus Omnitrophica bacterium]|nr:transposase [Candidatus Omnitrophota bacterium]
MTKFVLKKRFSAQQKIETIRLFLEKKYSIAEIGRQLGISRLTFYRWLKKYLNSKPEARILALTDNPVKGENHWKAVKPDLEKEILKIVEDHPDYSSHKIASLLENVGNHGIYNVLKRNNLNTYEQRLAYSQRMGLSKQPEV